MDVLKQLPLLLWECKERMIQVDTRVVWALIALLGTGTTAKLVQWLLLRYQLGQHRLKKRLQVQEALNTLTRQLDRDIHISAEQQAEILSLTFSDLQGQLKDGHFTPSQVLQAFQHKALGVHEETNCLEEPLLEAQAWATEVESESKKDLPLYGIPVSIKDGYGISGHDCSIGVARIAGVVLDKDCVIVKVLKQQGAIPFVRTNVPQTMMSYECSNPIFGATTNPHNKDRGPGGSSGGEAALIAGGGSVLGFGSDIAGSVRMPAAFCGICSLKPTQGRISMKDMMKLLEGQNFVLPDFGPMAKEVDGLVEVLRAVLSPVMFKLDPVVPPVCFNEQMYGDKQRLRVGYYVFDGLFHAVPSCERALMETVQVLRNLGHEVVEWNMAKYGPQMMDQYYPSVFADGGKDLMSLVEGDKIDKALSFFSTILSMNGILARLVAATVGKLYPNFGSIMKARLGVGSVAEYWLLGAKNKDLREAVYTDLRSQGIDILVAPGFCSPAMPHGLPGKCPAAWSGTAVYNFLHCPAGSLPVSKVKKEDIDKMDSYPTPDPWHKMIKQAQFGSEGLPLSVQVAALPWQDELVLRVMKELETAINY